jgi:hypothetical protein
MHFSRNGPAGWALMTPEERADHQAKMRAAKTYDECKAIQTEHRSLLEARAKAKGLSMPLPRQNGCEVMKARGLIS